MILFRFVLAAALVIAGLAPASAQFVPSGSYQQSCRNIRVNGNQLIANCTSPNGQHIRSSINVGCRGDIANVNGYLQCHGGGYGPGYGGGHRVPPGSYQGSCRNVYMQGGTLSAQCTAPNGQYIGSSLFVNQCRGADIANINGRLSCR